MGLPVAQTGFAAVNIGRPSCRTHQLTSCCFVLQLMPETLFLTVNLIDRFLNEKQVTRKNLQLVGVREPRRASQGKHSSWVWAARKLAQRHGG